MTTISQEFLRAMPKTDLHLHLDGSVRLQTLIELAKQEGVELPSFTVQGLQELVFKEHYQDLGEYLVGFGLVNQCLNNYDNMARVAYELGVDCFAENCRYIEVRFAPQLHYNDNFCLADIINAVNDGLARAKKEYNQNLVGSDEPIFDYGIIVCAMRMFLPVFSKYYHYLHKVHQFADDKTLQTYASNELVRCAVHLRDSQNIPIVALDLAGAENGFEAKVHRDCFYYAKKKFLGRTVHAGEAFGPASIHQAINKCHAQRIGHGYNLFNYTDYQYTQSQTNALAQSMALDRIPIEVCLTSNMNTLPSLREAGLQNHPVRKMIQTGIPVLISTDNRTVSRTTPAKEYQLLIKHFSDIISHNVLKKCVLDGFRYSFHSSRNYALKMDYLDKVDKLYDQIFKITQ